MLVKMWKRSPTQMSRMWISMNRDSADRSAVLPVYHNVFLHPCHCPRCRPGMESLRGQRIPCGMTPISVCAKVRESGLDPDAVASQQSQADLAVYKRQTQFEELEAASGVSSRFGRPSCTNAHRRKASVDLLQSLSEYLSSFQSDLAQISDQVEDLQRQSTTIDIALNGRAVCGLIVAGADTLLIC